MTQNNPLSLNPFRVLQDELARSLPIIHTLVSVRLFRYPPYLAFARPQSALGSLCDFSWIAYLRMLSKQAKVAFNRFCSLIKMTMLLLVTFRLSQVVTFLFHANFSHPKFIIHIPSTFSHPKFIAPVSKHIFYPKFIIRIWQHIFCWYSCLTTHILFYQQSC